MATRQHRNITFAILALLFLQFFFCVRFFEPYPAVILPGFAGVPDNSGQIEQEAYAVTAFAGQAQFELPPEALFPHQWVWHAYRSVDRLIRYERRVQSRALGIGHLQWSVAVDRRLPEADSLQFVDYIRSALKDCCSTSVPVDSVRLSWVVRSNGEIVESQWKSFKLN